MASLTITMQRKRRGLHGRRTLPHPVTVIVLTWNAVEETQALLDSIAENPLPSNANLLFVDNGSMDYTVDLLLSHDIRVIVNPENRGYTRAVNQALRATATDVVLLNNDTAILHDDWLDKLQETAYEPGVGVVGCRLIGHDQTVLHAGGETNPETHEGWNIHCDLAERRERIDCEFVTFGCAYLRRTVIEAVGLLDERFFAYFEDTDYCLRVRNHGLRVVMDGRVNLLHRESASSRANGVDAADLVAESRRRYVEKWFTPRTI